MSKPTNKPGWNPADPSKVVEPSSTKKAQGWAAGEKPAAEHFNWLMKTVSEWVDYVDTVPTGGELSAEDEARIAALEAAAGVVAPSPVTVTFPYLGGAAPSEYDAGAVIPSNAKTIDWANGASQYMLLDADCALSFSNPVAGNTYYLRIQQGGYGLKRVIGWPTNIIWNSGSVPTISTAAWTVDVIGCYYDGSNYYGYVSQGHFSAPTGTDTKNGYIAGGYSAGSSAVYVSQLERINFNSDTTLTVVQSEFGKILNSSGAYVYPSAPGSSTTNHGQGTQSQTHGYRIFDVYASLPTVNSQTTSATNKVAFSNDTVAIFSRLNGTNAASANMAIVRGGIIQNTTNAYKYSNNNSGSREIEKLTFSTDTVSRYTHSGTFGGNASYNNHSFGLSTPNSGVMWQANSTPNVLAGAKLTFSADTVIATALYLTPFNNQLGGTGEAVDGEYVGYYQRNTTGTAPSVSTVYRCDKSIDAWQTLTTTLSGVGAGAAAIQGGFAGYFCGGLAVFSGSVTTFNSIYPALNAIKKIQFAPETYSVHSTTLQAARCLGAGFEG